MTSQPLHGRCLAVAILAAACVLPLRAGAETQYLPPWEQPAFQKLTPSQQRAQLEFSDVFDHRKAQPVRRLRILEANPNAYQHPENLPPSLLLGDLLFHAPQLLGQHPALYGMSCASCHPGGSTTPDVDVGSQCTNRPGNVDLRASFFTPLADDGVYAPRNVPSLRGLRYTGPYDRDGSKASMHEVISAVLSTEFQQQVRPDWLDALTLYIAEFDFVPNKQLDSLGRLTDQASPEAHLGEKLFEQPRPQFAGMSCATCHIQESFFTDHRTHALRHGAGAGISVPEEGFKTPTLLDTAETAPYFFDGSAATLSAAVKQIDRQHKLQLTAEQQVQLTAYLEAVGAEDIAPRVLSLRERFDDSLAYLSLLLRGPMKDDAQLWPLCLDTVRHDLRAAARETHGKALATVDGPVHEFEAWVASADHQKPSAANRTALLALRDRLQRAGRDAPTDHPARADNR
jgi:cytochrome c peroxidase